MKIFSCNAGYLLDYDGAYRGYMLSPHRGLVGSGRAEQRAIERLVNVIADEAPDVVGLIEVDQGSIRTRTDGQVTRLADELERRGLVYTPYAESKYGNGVLDAVPILRYLSNGVLVAGDHETTVHYLDTGPKRLVIEVSLPELDVFNTHLAMSGRARRRQLRELADLVGERERAILSGDFNAYNGFDEIRDAFEGTEMELHDPGATVPPRPLDSVVLDTRSLDFFLSSPEIRVTRCETLDVQVSDHRPVVLECEP